MRSRISIEHAQNEELNEILDRELLCLASHYRRVDRSIPRERGHSQSTNSTLKSTNRSLCLNASATKHRASMYFVKTRNPEPKKERSRRVFIDHQSRARARAHDKSPSARQPSHTRHRHHVMLFLPNSNPTSILSTLPSLLPMLRSALPVHPPACLPMLPPPTQITTNRPSNQPRP